ncbi:succinyldiaminopimelate transaminase [Timonella senegalensis]|uniref:succinyldiaminopimelate transaminase n=1 Tax=Timonella senegalensis TaxID=1465825 RepID=UPI0028A5AB65|nr:succinyldiaminopimelate transaminase [Timonella senegalensis]
MGFADITDIAFPWDLLVPFGDLARSHTGGIVDLSVGTPVDPTPQVLQNALAQSADSHGYPQTYGTPQLRDAVSGWFARRRNVANLDPRDVLPTVGSKELVALLPAMLSLGAGDIVVHPEIAYPTYDVGARLAGATPLPADDVEAWRGNERVKLVWVNSPGNPHGRVLGVSELKAIVDAAREIGALVVSDECYAELPWTEPFASEGVPSVLDPRVCGDNYNGVLVTYSLSKQSNLAGYRAAFVAGDSATIQGLLALRKHLGMIVPGPVQDVMAVGLSDDSHVGVQRELYRARRSVMLGAIESAGLTVTSSEAGLYLWVRGNEAFASAVSAPTLALVERAQREMPGACWLTVGYLAERGILVAPGAFYGAGGAEYVRVALTASDERIAVASERLSS